MSRIYLSALAGPELRAYLAARGHELRLLPDDGRLGAGVSSHADLRFCKLGGEPGAPVLAAPPDFAAPGYPENAAWCAVFLDRYLIHRTDVTAPPLLRFARGAGLELVAVRQGYARCSCAVVDGRSLITSDPGLFAALGGLGDVEVLKIRPGFVRLRGYEYGFLGGASGRVGGELLFNGDLSTHPDFAAIQDFTSARGVKLRYFGGPLEDIGSIIEQQI